ncbi:Plastocyanin [Sphingomonas laterariae]|uniref:Plastocyanin n=2 Tax=Edaphosphingomonas laterariae TaxID=861865 RepID=A0A239JMF6_9SPHN|nr:Plastocyanin [Sphingomonas laterariae]
MRIPGPATARALSALLLLLATADLPARAATDWAAAERIDITLSNFAFTPVTMHLRAGQPYRLHFVNAGSGGHNFAAQDFFARASYPSGVGPDGGKVELAKGASADVSLIPVAGRYKAKCTHFMHSTLGMAGEIIVE